MSQDNRHRHNLNWIRWGIIALGGAMILFAAIAKKIGLSSPGNFGYGQFLLVLVGFLFLAAGFLGRGFANYYKGAALLLFNTVILFFFMELISQIATRTIDKLSQPIPTEVSVTVASSMPYYASQDWSTVYWQDIYDIVEKQQYYPWVVWRSVPFKSVTININQDGIRQTPGADCSPGAYKVFVFGGSTVWGWGAPDWITIPAYLQTGLAKLRNQPICTINFGQIGYVSSQGVIELMTQLQHRNTPNLVIFYDGVNDIFAGYQTGQACVHQNLSDIAAKFENRDIPPENPMINLLHSTITFDLFQRLIGNPKNSVQKMINYRSMGIDKNRLADSIAECYFGNYELTSALASEYGFDYAFFWQPAISIGNKPLTSDEEAMKGVDEDMESLYAATYRIVENSTSEYKNLYYLADIFDQQTAQIWIDRWSHVTPVGNALVAEFMLQKVGNQPFGK